MWSMLLGWFTLVNQVDSAMIIGISTIKTQVNEVMKKGSFRGGTDLFIRADFESGDPNVYSVLVGGKVCKVVHFDSDESTIHCIVPPADSDFNSNVPISITSTVEEVTFDSSVTMNFSYDYERTPWILYINPTEACPGDEIAFVGRWGTTDWAKIDSAKVGTQVLNILDDIQQLDYWGYHNVTGVINDNLHGDTGAEISLSDGFGNSATTWLGSQFTPSGSSYNFRTSAKIDEVSHNEGSHAGGLQLTLTGAGFLKDSSVYDIKADGKDCVIDSISYDTILCTTSENSSPSESGSVFEGGAGLMREYWESKEALSTLIGNTFPSQVSVILTPQLKLNEADNTRTRLYGLFLATETGNYKFYISSDDSATVYLSTDNSPANKQAIITFTSWTELKDKFRESTLVSNDIYLTAGMSYYLEVHHNQGSGGAHFELGVEMPGNGPNKPPFIQHVKIGPSTLVREVQKVKIGFTSLPTGGNLILKYGGTSLDPVSWDSESSSWKCSDILSAIGKLKIGSFLCSLTQESTSLIYSITFNYAKTTARKLFSVDNSQISPSGIPYSTTKIPGSIPVDGTYTISYKGVTSAPLGTSYWIRGLERDLNIKFPDLKSKLFLRGSTNADGVDLYFMLPADFAGSDQFSFDISLLTGGGIEGALDTRDVAITLNVPGQVASGRVFYHVIPSEFLRTYHTDPQIVVSISGRKIPCRGICKFLYIKPPLYPEVTEITESGDYLTVTGTLFVEQTMSVEIGFASCGITSESSTQISCVIPRGSAAATAVAGTWSPIVRSENKGIVSSLSTTTITIPLVISSISPSSGSEQGGTILTITGKGFLNSLSNLSVQQSITIGNSPCSIISTSTTVVTCKTSAKSSDNTLTVQIGSTSQTSSSFTYEASKTPVITSISPTTASTIVKTTVTISGSNFGTDKSLLQVKLTSSTMTLDCLVTSVSDSSISCNINGGPRDTYTLSLFRDPEGFASFSGASSSIPFVLKITSISPKAGSVNGGTLITVGGEGFSTEKLFMTAFIGSQENQCSIKSSTSTSFTCLTPEIGENILDNDYEFIVYGRLTDRATCETADGSCNFMWSNSATPEVTNITPAQGKNGDSVTIAGTGFGTDSSKVTVTFGDELATVTSVSDNSIVVTVPLALGSTLELGVNIGGKGIASGIFNFDNDVNVLSVSPLEISKAGGVVVIQGSGFDDTMTVTFGGVSCVVKEILKDKITCIASSYSTDENAKLLNIGSFTCPDSAICGLSYKASKTFTMTSKSGNLAIAGTFPSSLSNDNVQVVLKSTTSEYTCSVTSISTSSISCTPQAPAGTYSISVHLDGYGFISGTLSYTLALSVTSVSAPSCSFAGGATLTVSGTALHESSIVRVCGSKCEVTSATGSQLLCNLPPLATTYSLSTFKVKSSEKLDYFTIVSSLSTGNTKAFDNDITTFYKDGTNADDFIGIDVKTGWKFNLQKIKFIGGGSNQAKYKELVGTLLQGSNDGTTWTSIKKFTTINNFWNSWSVKPGVEFKFRFFRLFQAAASADWIINDVEFYGIRYLDSSSIQQTCDIEVYSTASASPVSASGTASYMSSLTAVVNKISPEIGTTAGGVSVEFTGQGFGTTAADVTVIIDNVPCAVNSVIDTKITCTTGARTEYTEKSLEIRIANKGLVSTQGLLFTYAERWSDTATWGGEVPPREGETVYIPAGMNLILDQKTPLLQAILVEGSLIVEDIPNITIDAYYIFVHGGHFQIGTEESPFLNDITITMHGNRLSPTLPNYGNKFIAVRNGVLDIHGSPRTPSWSLLLETANIGDTSIKLQDAVNWKAGEQIVLATTSYSLAETETAIIDHVDSNSANIIYLTAPLKFKHYAETETYGSDTMEIRGEVGLLSRNIKIRGSDEGLDTQHGVHIMLFSPGDESVVGRVENLELFYAGQAFTLGRYPLHFHMIGTVSQSYIKNNAIHHTFNRATTVHGVFYLTIQDNVAYHTMGHTFFIEDGIESQNTLAHNLGINVYQSFSLLNGDQTPAVFWITNPNNFIHDNHAAGGMAYGFWFDFNLHPRGPSATSAVWPEFMELGQFEDNTAHSLAKYGLRIFHRFFPSTTPGDPIADYSKRDWWDVPNVPITAEFKRLTAWKCKRDGAIAEDVGDVRFIDFKVADNIIAGIELTYTHWTKWYQTTRVVNALIVGNSGNSEGACANTVGLLTPQTDGLYVNGAKFYNFDDTMHPMGDESHSFKPPTRDHGARLVKLEKLVFGNSHKKIAWGVPPTGFWQILDDSLTGTAGFVAAYWPHLLNKDCTDQKDTYNSIVCTGSAIIRRVGFHGLNPMDVFNVLKIKILRESGGDVLTETVTNEDGTTSLVPVWSGIDMQKGGKNHGNPLKAWNVPFVTGYKYRIHWGSSPVDWLGFKIEQSLFEGSEWVHLNFNFTDHRENFLVSRGVLPAGVKTSDPGFIDVRQTTRKTTPLVGTDPSGTYFWTNQSDAEAFEVMINGVQGNENQWGDLTVTPYRCYGAHCTTVSVTNETVTEKTMKFWSDVSSWPAGMPTAGSFVEIPSSWHMYLDIDTPVFQKVEINGILEFSPNKSASLHAHWVFIRKGELRSGSETDPTKKTIQHEVVLYGEPLDDSFAFNPDVQGGNKVIVVTGNLSLFGYPKESFAKLEQNVYPGDSYIFVSQVDWAVGDEIAISPSGFKSSEHEVFVITEVTGAAADYDQVKAGQSVADTDFSADPQWVLANSFRQNGKSKVVTDPNQQAQPAPTTGITKLKLDKPVTYYHSGAPLMINDYLVDMRTEVALISRNVKITTEQNGWTGAVVVNDYLDELVDTDPVFRTGKVDLSHVYFDECGQFDTNLACLRFESVGSKASSVQHCAFKSPQTWAVFLKDAANLTFSHNLIYNGRWRGIVATKITDVVFHNNMIISIYQRNYVAAILDASAGFFVCSGTSPICTFQMTENKVLGFEFAGFIMSGGECDKTDKFNSGNKVRSGFTGFLYTNNGRFDCMELSNNVAHFTEEALGFKSSTNQFRLSNFEFVENLNGIGIRTARAEDQTYVAATLSNSVFIGKTIHSLCQDCKYDLDCQQKFGYLFGQSDSGVAEINMIAKIKVPLYAARANANAYGSQTVDGVQFMNFNANTKCKRNDFAITSNDHSPDYQLPQFFKNIKFFNVGANNKVYMNDPNPAWLNEEDCVDWNCTGPLNAIGFDLDGSVVGGSGGYILPNSPGIAKADICTLNPTMNAYLCIADSSDKNKYMMMIFESLDDDKSRRTFAPINVTSYGNSFVSENGKGFRNDIAHFQDHVWDGFYTGHIRLSRFPGIVYSGQYYNITSRGTLPNNLEFRLDINQDLDLPIVVAVRYMDPASVHVYVDDVLVPGYKWSKGVISECSLTDSHGTNRWFHEQNTIQFVLRTKTAIQIRKVSSVKINLELDIDLDNFFNNNGEIAFLDKFAAMLNIPSYRIRIVNVKQGSTILDIYIPIDETLDSSTDQANELNQVHDAFKESAKSGTLGTGLGYNVLKYSSEVSVVSDISESEDSESNEDSQESETNQDSESDNENNGETTEDNDPNGGNLGSGTSSTNHFKVVADDWLVGVFGGIIFLLIVLSGLVLYTKNANKSVSLYDVQSKFTSKVGDVNDAAHKGAWGSNEENKENQVV